ncbi:MBL fold metallo-hydrolase [Deinococcus soli (ex Cha et al. 2016)]|uniref:MBL fold metallo-hydrolase n=1 Tax=Deinococcus soli (ex Cha et al. 2016) TaxID=1309411 RepID=UPI00166C581F|nr:MBL fold metallo-hydrolase [Deinococcus soli (ex Cha et al. 2016)]GGB56050.1 Zn-dependent hydrolase [Deinococcus soli (ex Cha et al. 2016)]
MFFERFYNADLAQASYLIGCQKTGESLVIDPVRDVQPYLDRAAREGLRVTHVTETHIHADYLSGSRELAARTGAQLLLSAEGGVDWRYGFAATPLHHGDTFMVGNLRIAVRHTPGHTQESLSFLVTDTPRGNTPVMYFTGDFVFVGDIGRPDLLDEAAGGVDTRFAGARQMFASLRDQFLTLPDGVQVWPAHGAGSACGKALGAVPTTTVGYERALAWWAPYVASGDEQGFTAELLSGQPDAPLYYGRMKDQNRAGPALLGDVTPLAPLSVADLKARMAAGTVLIDTRARTAHQADAPQGSVNIPDGNTFETWSGWLLRPEDAAYVLLARDAAHAETLRRRLWMVGLDQVTGFVTSTDGLETTPAQPFPAAELPRHAGALILDVRNKTEHQAGAIPGAQQLHAGRLAWQLDALPRDQEIVVHCQGGARSAAAASFLRARGFQVSELAGGYDAYTRERDARPV